MFSGMSDTASLRPRIDVLLVDRRVLGVGVAQRDRGRRLLDDEAGDGDAVRSCRSSSWRYWSAMALLGRRIDSIQVLAAGLLADHRQVGADLAAGAADRVAFETLHVVLDAGGQQRLALGRRRRWRLARTAMRRQLLRVDLAAAAGTATSALFCRSRIGAVAQETGHVVAATSSGSCFFSLQVRAATPTPRAYPASADAAAWRTTGSASLLGEGGLQRRQRRLAAAVGRPCAAPAGPAPAPPATSHRRRVVRRAASPAP